MRPFPFSLTAPSLCWALALGCSFDLSDVPVRIPPDAGKRGISADSGQATGGRDAGVLDGGSAGTPDAGLPPPVSPVRHASCAIAAPSPLPLAPQILTDARGRPVFDRYRDISCEEAADSATCTQVLDCGPGSRCILLDQPGIGVCGDRQAEVYPAMSFDDGRCVTHRSDLAHARACCDGLPGFDCRVWPYQQSSTPGQLCARHEDCELGLVCKERRYSGVGLCVCPDLDALDIPWC